MLPFLQDQTEPKLNGYYNSSNIWSKWISSHNIDDLNLLFFSLIKKGYGSLKEVKEFDTNEVIQILEYEYLLGAIEFLEYEEMNQDRK